MNNSITFDLPFRAIPKANKHKIAQRGGGRFAKRTVVNDLTGVVAKSEESFAWQALACLELEERDDLPWSDPIEATVVFVYTPTPAKPQGSWPRWQWLAALAGFFRYTKTPDLENVAKFVFDALEKVFYTDDKLIWRQTLEKRYGPEERVIVTLARSPQETAKTWKERNL